MVNDPGFNRVSACIRLINKTRYYMTFIARDHRFEDLSVVEVIDRVLRQRPSYKVSIKILTVKQERNEERWKKHIT